MTRREFPAKVKVAAFERCGGRCEFCTRRLAAGDFHYDHVIPDQIGGEPTLENCCVLCRACHGEKTAKRDAPTIARARRRYRSHIGARKAKQPIRGWRTFAGEPVRNPKLARPANRER